MKDLSGKVAFITGGGSGVALGQAKVFAGAGMKVVIADIRQDHLDEALAWFAKRPGAQVHAGEIVPVRGAGRLALRHAGVLLAAATDGLNPAQTAPAGAARAAAART